MSPEQFQLQLLNWYDAHGRKDLPWRQHITPYRVWLSEIMLQQTQVSSVIPYFNKFVGRFPNVQSLAAAELDEVLQYWSGLGYYARARNLHKTARQIAAKDGQFPLSVAALCALPGIGKSTAGAILSIAEGQCQPILDGNVKRVLARYHAIHGWTGESKVSARLWEISSQYTPRQRSAAYTQAIMDLGATLCTRSKPKCDCCPVSLGCHALALGLSEILPQARPRKTLPVKQLYFLILSDAAEQILLEKRPPVGIWGGLWSVPEFADIRHLQDWCMRQNYEIGLTKTLPKLQHSFSHYQLEYTPVLATLKNPINNVMEANSRLWYKAADIETLGLPTPVKRLLQKHINNEENYD